MSLNLLKSFLEDRQINLYYPDIVELIKRRISNGEVDSLSIGNNKFPAKHFVDIYSFRMKYSATSKCSGLNKAIKILKRSKDLLRLGRCNTNNEHIVFFISEDLKRPVALFSINKMELEKNGKPDRSRLG